ncbi:hypothetical protein D3C80_2201820 [compost metagenome]
MDAHPTSTPLDIAMSKFINTKIPISIVVNYDIFCDGVHPLDYSRGTNQKIYFTTIEQIDCVLL